MSFAELLLIAVGLAMDAFAVSICKGLSLQNIRPKHMLTAGVWFGGFQALMPVLGFYTGRIFSSFVQNYSNWIAFAILALIGINMIRDAGEEENADASMAPKEMLLLAIATSIDALAVGASFALLHVQIIPAAALIGCTTFLISAAGIRVGAIFGTRFRSRAQIAGGLILIAIGIRILVQGLLK